MRIKIVVQTFRFRPNVGISGLGVQSVQSEEKDSSHKSTRIGFAALHIHTLVYRTALKLQKGQNAPPSM
jgi:hypothetical protein